jgi:multicomponent Na+:H+ antiporter subunit G
MREVLIYFFLFFGAGMILIAAIGCLRLPDLYTRMHAATKSGTVGIMGIVIAMMIYVGETSVIWRGILVILFFLLTAPVAAHMIGRAAYRSGVPLWEKTCVDEWRKKASDTVE